MVKIRKIQQAIMGLDGGEYQEIMNDYLHKKFKYSNITCLGSEVGTSKTTSGTPDTYVETNDGKYILIMYGTVEKQSFNKIRDDIIDAYNKDKSYIDENRIEKVICCYTSNNINIAQREELKNICEVHIYKSKILIITREPKNESLLIGEKVPEKYLWSLNYRVYFDNENEIDKIIEVLKDVYDQIK